MMRLGWLEIDTWTDDEGEVVDLKFHTSEPRWPSGEVKPIVYAFIEEENDQ